MRVAICDNDSLFLDTFSRQVQKNSGIEDVETFSSYHVFLENLSGNYDLVFMDLDWDSDVNGVDIAARVGEEHAGAKIVFVTSYIDKFVEEIFLQKTNIAGILTKPVKEDMLEIYIQKIGKELEEKREKVLQVRENNRQIIIPVSEIIYLESHNHVVDINTIRRTYHVYEPLANLNERLPKDICRCHRGFLVNLKYIQEMRKNEIQLSQGTPIPIGRSYRTGIEASYVEYLKNRI